MADDPPKLFIAADKFRSSGKPPSQRPTPLEHETPNPLPDKYHSDEHHHFTDDEENDPESEDE